MFFPRAMNNEEQRGLALVKESNLSYEVKFCYSQFSGGYTVNIPLLCGNYTLSQSKPFLKDLKMFQEKESITMLKQLKLF